MRLGFSPMPLIIFGVVCIVGVSMAFIIHHVEKQKERRFASDINSIKERISELFSATFTAELCNSYANRMATKQPIDNDRILPGRGKEHTLKMMIERTDNGSTVPSIIEQIGDVFS